MVWIVVGLVAWVGFSFMLAPIVGFTLRRCDVLDQTRSIEARRAMAQHPAGRAA